MCYNKHIQPKQRNLKMEFIFSQDRQISDIITQDNDGRISISLKVFGYWPFEMITVYASRMYRGTNNKSWKITITHGSGGRDTAEVESDTVAFENFGKAILEAARVARALELHIPELEAGYQRGLKKYELEQEEKRKLLQAAVDADPAIGLERASNIVSEMIQELHSTKFASKRSFYLRGSESQVAIFRVKMGKTRPVFRVNGSTTTKKGFVDLIASVSARGIV